MYRFTFLCIFVTVELRKKNELVGSNTYLNKSLLTVYMNMFYNVCFFLNKAILQLFPKHLQISFFFIFFSTSIFDHFDISLWFKCIRLFRDKDKNSFLSPGYIAFILCIFLDHNLSCIHVSNSIIFEIGVNIPRIKY